MEDLGRVKHSQQARERGTVVDEAESWRSLLRPEGQDHGRGYSPKTKKGQGWPFGVSPKRRAHFGSPGSSPEGYKFGHSPSQREGFRKFPTPDSPHNAHEENWRERPQQSSKGRWRRDSQGENKGQRKEGFKSRSGKDLASMETLDSPGSRQKARDQKRTARDNHKVLSIEDCLSIKDLLRLNQEEEEKHGDDPLCLKEKSCFSPNTEFNCDECRVFLQTVSDALRHIKEKPHRKTAKERRELNLLFKIPPPEKDQTIAIGSALEGVVKEFGLSDQDVEQRRQIVSLMEEVFKPVLPESTLRLYGSSCTKFGFKDSDVNIDIQFPSHMHQPDVLILVKECLTTSTLFVNVEADFHTRVAVVVCKEKDSGLVCKVSAGNDSACLTTAYLAELTKEESRLLPLVVGFRHWAQICHVDQMEEGGLPPYSIALMVIFFLQKRRVPILPTYMESVGDLPYAKLKDFTLTSVENGHVLWEYHPPPINPPKLPRVNSDFHHVSKIGMTPLVFQGSSCVVEVGQLWVELLRFYAIDELHMSDIVISVRRERVHRDEKDWPRKRIAIEDPFSVKRNVARTVNSQLMFDYFTHCLKTTYKYFGLPLNQPAAKNKAGGQPHPNDLPGSPSDMDHVESGMRSLRVASEETKRQEPDGEAGQLEDSDCVIEDVEEEEDSDSEEEEDDLELEEEEDDEDIELDESRWDGLDDELFPLDELSEGVSESEEEDTPGSVDEEEVPPPAVAVSRPSAEDPPKYVKSEKTDEALNGFHYEFKKHVFTSGKSHTLVCIICKHDGHLKRDCPEDFKRVALDPLQPMTPKFRNTLDEVCVQCYKDFAPDEIEEQVREHILQDLEAFIRHQFEGARLKLFGSSKNGFGFKQSDLDICMVLEGKDTAVGLDCIAIIESLARALRKHQGLKNILPITTAKVPIVKFYHIKTGLEGDISLYNTLALHNTQLLASYAAIDPRVKVLCYVMKVFAKVCDIGDASRGSLSSYAYTLMVLFFLQQRNPPVIPVLQEIYDGQKKPEVLVDYWNVYFFKDLEDLPRRWPPYQKNMESVGELWLGLLQFYTEVFDFKEHVICIRRKPLLTTFKKQWTSKYIVIEDPFDLNHNLGAGLSRRMTNFIMKAFINGRTVFGSPISVFPSEYSNKMEYFFDTEVLTEGELAPNDRCCRICGKIGHFMKDCPMRKKSRHRREYEGLFGGREGSEQGMSNREFTPNKDDRWRRQEEKRCFLCGSSAHIKRDCPQKTPAGGSKTESGTFSSSPSSNQMRIIREKERQGSPQQEGNRKSKAKKVILGPQAGSPASRHMPLSQLDPGRSPVN